MKKMLSCLMIVTLLCTIITGIGFFEKVHANSSQTPFTSIITKQESNDLATLFSKYTDPVHPKQITTLQLPWITDQSQLLEWYIQIQYNNQTFQKKVPVNITDFDEKFLKHPEYGEKIRFNIDDDPEEDIEVIASFYWSVIIDENGNDIKSLEKRIQVRQLASGNYISDQKASLQVWSELHVNYGLIKKEKSTISILEVIKKRMQTLPSFFNRIKQFINQLHLFEKSQSLYSLEQNKIITQQDDADHITVGTGYYSPAGEDIPRYAEKRFAIARENLFSPSLFQQQMDPGSSKGKGPFDLLYGFKAYKQGSSNPSYDISFSVEFNPAVYLKTKFIPINGQIYYYFEDASQQDNSTAITFTSNVLAGTGEDVELTLTFDEIDETLGRIGRWLTFDIDVLGDHDLLSGKFEYEGSHIFDIGVIVSSPFFEEKIEFMHIPKTMEVSWDLDFVLVPTPIFVHADGFFDISMSSPLGGIQVYYPKTNPNDPEQIFLDVPQGIPDNVRIDAAAKLDLGQTYVYGNIKHTCSDNIECIRAFLPEHQIDETKPIINVTQIPSLSEAKGKLNWNTFQGYAYLWRGSHGVPDPIELNLKYDTYSIHNIFTIRNGHIDTRFKLAENGNFYFDTTESIFGTELMVNNANSGDSLGLSVNEVSADNLQADWNLDTSGESLKINDFHFSGMIDVLDSLQLNLDYQGKTTSAALDWHIGQSGDFSILMDQETDLSIDFDAFALNSTDFDFGGGITLSENIRFDMSWDLKQGTGSSGESVEPGFFAINKNNDDPIIKNFDFYVIYQDQYGVNISFSNLQFYLNVEWWKGDRLLPYVWIDYEFSANDFDVNLLWTNANEETQWYENVEDW